MAAGKVTTYKLAVSNAAATEQIFTGVEPIEIKLLADNATTHVILTPASSSTDATTSGFLLPNSSEVSFEVGRGLDRISAITSAGSGNIYIAVLS